MKCEPPKPVVGLNTTPVGADIVPAGEPEGAGTVTTSGWAGGGGWATPAPLYNVATPIPLSEAQIGLPVELASPQGLTRFGSRNVAIPGRSETRLFWVYCAPAREGIRTAQRPNNNAKIRRCLLLEAALAPISSFFI